MTKSASSFARPANRFYRTGSRAVLQTLGEGRQRHAGRAVEQGRRGRLVRRAIPPEYGGPGGDFLYNIILNEELGKFVGGASVGAAITTDVMTNILVEHGTHEQKLRWCPGNSRGRRHSVSRADGAWRRQRRQWHPGPRTASDGDHFVLNGNKCYMSSGSKANLVYFVAKTDDDLQRGKRRDDLLSRRCEEFARRDAAAHGHHRHARLGRRRRLFRKRARSRGLHDRPRGRRAAHLAQGHLHARSHDHRDPRIGRCAARVRYHAGLRQAAQGIWPIVCSISRTRNSSWRR